LSPDEIACSMQWATWSRRISSSTRHSAAGALYPLFGILLSPMVGTAAMALSSVSVIANALRLARVRLD
jgi:cation transport ATPase